MGKKLFSGIIGLIILLIFTDWSVFAADPGLNLKEQIDQKAQELNTINKQLEETRQQLESTKNQRSGLQRELNSINYQINQLNLNIKSGEVSVQKLTLEIQSLGDEIDNIRESINLKKSAIAKIIREFQRNDEANLLLIFLKNASLADSVFEVQSLKDLNNQLAVAIEELKNLYDNLQQKILESGDKKSAVQLENANLKNRRAITGDQKKERQIILTQTKNKETVYQQQLTELQKRQKQIADEIETLEAELRTKIDPRLLPRPGKGILFTPVNGILSQDYGATRFAEYGYQGKWHNGVDIAAPIGTPIFAAEEGTVAAVGNQDGYCYKGAYGKFIVINHNNNLTTLYAHLSRYIVSAGEKINRGQLIGYVGRTGYATGAHLHLTVFAQPTFRMGPSRMCGPMPFGGDLNPLSYL